MKIVVAPQALKGSLEAVEVGAAIAAGLRAALPDVEVVVVPVADGGEGTVAALVSATGGRLLTQPVTGPLGKPVEATFGLLGPSFTAFPPQSSVGAYECTPSASASASASASPPRDRGGAGGEVRSAVIEMAAASGLPLVPRARRDPRIATTRGTGELIRAALDAGARRLLIGIGGSATNDGGAGMAQALGARLLDAAGLDLPPGGAALARLARIDVQGLDPRLADCEVIVASDVTNPLCGPHGASAVYGPQKGATPAMVAELDAALAHYATLLQRDLGAAVAETPGAGAAGGLGAGLLAFLHAQLRPGAALVLEAISFDERLRGAALVFTAEGRLDEQTAYGKAVSAVAEAALRQRIPVVALAGGLRSGYEALYARGINAVVPIADGPLALDESMRRARELLAAAAERALRLVLVGMRFPWLT
jgi:glycerate kinase